MTTQWDVENFYNVSLVKLVSLFSLIESSLNIMTLVLIVLVLRFIIKLRFGTIVPICTSCVLYDRVFDILRLLCMASKKYYITPWFRGLLHKNTGI